MKEKPTLLDWLTKTSIGALLLLLIGTVIGYLIFVKYYNMANIYALVGFVFAAILIIFRNIDSHD